MIPDLRKKIIIPINASSLAKLNCETRYGMTIFRGLHPKPNEYATFGVAVHEYAQQYVDASSLSDIAPKIKARYPRIDGPQFFGACAARSRISLGLPLKREIHFNEFLFQRVTDFGTLVEFRLMGTIDDVSWLDNHIYITDHKTKRTSNFDRAIAEYENGVQLTFYRYVFQKYYAKLIPLNYHSAVTAGKVLSRYCMIMLSLNGQPWKLGPTSDFPPDVLFTFEAQLECQVERIFELYCLYEEAGFQKIHKDGWINNSCPKCEYKSYCHAKNAFELNMAIGELDEYVYDPMNYQHESTAE